MRNGSINGKLSEVEILENREEFLNLVSSIEREGADIEGLVRKLNNSDFFRAPASTKYHGGYEGGLCEHCLNVYYNLIDLVQMTNRSILSNPLDECCYDENSLKIVALLHDMSKMNFYEKTVSNKKIYSDNGSKKDEMGRYDWVSVPSFKTRDKKFVYGNHEVNAEFIVRHYIPLTLDESAAIINHMGGMSYDAAQHSMTEVFNSYSLVTLLHIADIMATYINERTN